MVAVQRLQVVPVQFGRVAGMQQDVRIVVDRLLGVRVDLLAEIVDEVLSAKRLRLKDVRVVVDLRIKQETSCC